MADTLDDLLPRLVADCRACAGRGYRTPPALAAWQERDEELQSRYECTRSEFARHSPAVVEAEIALAAHAHTYPACSTPDRCDDPATCPETEPCTACEGIGRLPTETGWAILEAMSVFLPLPAARHLSVTR